MPPRVPSLERKNRITLVRRFIRMVPLIGDKKTSHIKIGSACSPDYNLAFEMVALFW